MRKLFGFQLTHLQNRFCLKDLSQDHNHKLIKLNIMPTSFGDFFKANKDLNKFDTKKTFTLKSKTSNGNVSIQYPFQGCYKKKKPTHSSTALNSSLVFYKSLPTRQTKHNSMTCTCQNGTRPP